MSISTLDVALEKQKRYALKDEICKFLVFILPSLKLTASLHLKMDSVGIRGRFLLGFGLFSMAQELDLEEADLAQLRIEVGGCLGVTKG